MGQQLQAVSLLERAYVHSSRDILGSHEYGRNSMCALCCCERSVCLSVCVSVCVCVCCVCVCAVCVLCVCVCAV